MIASVYKRYVLPVSILSGTIIGAGVFALPYVFVRAGWLIAFGYLALLTGAVTVIHRMFAQVIFKTPGEHRFVGYVERYLGRGWFWLALLTSILGLLLTLTAYLILGAEFLDLLYEGSDSLKIMLMWIVGSALVLLRVRMLALLEFLVVAGILLIIGIIFAVGAGGIEKIALLPPINPRAFFLPFGPILFALIGRTAISSVVQYAKTAQLSERAVQKTIMWGTVIPAVFYALFVIGVIGLSSAVSEDSVSGLSGASPAMLFVVGILGLLALLSTYIVLGIEIIENLSLDLRIPRKTSAGLVIGTPILFYFFGLKSFLELISIVGGVFVALEGVMVILMWRKVAHPTRWRRIFSLVLITIFFLGALYEIMKTIT